MIKISTNEHNERGVSIVTCDDCFARFILPKLKRTVLKDLVYKFYFHCPDCNHEYVSYYTNPKIRRDIKRQQKRWGEYRKTMVNNVDAVGREMLDRINIEDKLLEREMNALKARMDGL